MTSTSTAHTRLSGLGSSGVVIGVDGSEFAEAALVHAAALAAREGRHLVVAVARDWPHPAASSASAAVLASEAATWARGAHPGLDVVTVVEDGDPRTLLLDLGARARVVVVGSRGRGPLRTLLLGSVSASLARLATCPVHVCRPRTGAAVRGVLVGADGTADSLPVVRYAFEQAASLGTALQVVHYAWDAAAAAAAVHAGAVGTLQQDDAEEMRLLLAESVAGLHAENPDVPVTLVADHGLVDGALADASHDWHLVVVGRHPIRSARRVLTGGVASAVLERAHCPVAVVPVDG